MKTNKPEVVAWMWRDINGDVQFNYMHPDGEELIRLADHERLQAETERLQAECELWKSKIDAMAEHQVAAHQLIGIPASVGISEPLEGFVKRPQDIMPAVRDMALLIEALQAECAADEARIAELTGALSELRDWYQEHTGLPACRANAALKEPSQ